MILVVGACDESARHGPARDGTSLGLGMESHSQLLLLLLMLKGIGRWTRAEGGYQTNQRDDILLVLSFVPILDIVIVIDVAITMILLPLLIVLLLMMLLLSVA
jgi:hypothetical protein